MCFITHSFIDRIKYEMGSLGYRPKNAVELDGTKLKEIVANSLLRVKDTLDSFKINYHYQWIIGHWKKIIKSMFHKKWQLNNTAYSKVDISRNKEFYNNVAVITNIFSNNFVNIYYDDGIKFEDVPEVKTKDNLFEIVDTKEGQFIFTKDYLSTLKKNKYVDINNALAEFDLNCVDDRRNKYVSYIIFNEEIIKNTYFSNIAKSEIESIIMSKMALRSMQMMSLIRTINIIKRK